MPWAETEKPQHKLHILSPHWVFFSLHATVVVDQRPVVSGAALLSLPSSWPTTSRLFVFRRWRADGVLSNRVH